QGESARHEEIERAQREAVQRRGEEELRVVGETPADEHEERHADDRAPHPPPRRRHARPLASAPAYATDWDQRDRPARSGGSLANTPSFMTARSFEGSRRIERFASGSPSTSSTSAR